MELARTSAPAKPVVPRQISILETPFDLAQTGGRSSTVTATAQPGPNGEVYADFRETFALVQNVTNRVERPFYLPQLATESLTPVVPGQSTVVNNPTLGITLTVEPGAAVNDADGTPFTGSLSIREVPRNLAPGNLPETLDPDILITIKPVGVSYTTPAAISFDGSDFASGMYDYTQTVTSNYERIKRSEYLKLITMRRIPDSSSLTP